MKIEIIDCMVTRFFKMNFLYKTDRVDIAKFFRNQRPLFSYLNYLLKHTVQKNDQSVSLYNFSDTIIFKSYVKYRLISGIFFIIKIGKNAIKIMKSSKN